MGGNRHGEWVDLLDGARMWVDLQNACRHVLRKLTWAVTDIRDGSVRESYVLYVAVHEQLQGPSEMDAVTAMLNSITMNEFARTHGEAQEIPKEPAGADLVIPGESG